MITTPEEWWGNLSEETQDRLAADPNGPVPEDLWRDVLAANTGTDLYPPFRSSEERVLRGSFVAHIYTDNDALLAKITSAGLFPGEVPTIDALRERARRRRLMGT